MANINENHKKPPQMGWFFTKIKKLSKVKITAVFFPVRV